MEDLHSLLDTYNSAALDRIARFHGVLPKQSKSKSSIMKILEVTLVDPLRIKQTVSSMTATERAALDAILRRGGKASVRNIREELARLDMIDRNAPVEFSPYSYQKPEPNAQDSRRLEDILARLTLFGLVFSADDAVGAGSYEYSKRDFTSPLSIVFIPNPILKHMPKPAPLPERKRTQVQVSTFNESSARSFQRELYLYWGYIRDHSPSVTAKEELQKKALRDVNDLLLLREEIKSGKGENDYPRLRFLRQVLLGLKLITLNRDQTFNITGVTDFFALSAADRVRRTYDTWRQENFYNELMMLLPVTRIKTLQQPLIPAPKPVVRARQFVIDMLRRDVPKDWRLIQDVVDTVRDQDYEFLFPRPKRTSYYYYGLQHPYDTSTNSMGLSFPDIYNEEKGWDIVEANFIRAIIRGPLFWMGLVDLGIQDPKRPGPDAFRLTSLGQWLLNLGPLPEIPTEGGRIVVQPNLHIIALDPVQDSTLVTLDHFADRLTAERAVEYRLTRQSVYAGQQEGWDVSRVKEFLTTNTGSDLPANVARTLDEWQLQYERVTIHPEVVLAHGSAEIIDRFEKEKNITALVAARPHPEVAILKDKRAISPLVKALQANEILPLVTRRETVPGNSILAEAGGDLRFRARFPNLYLHGHLASFADPVEDRYRITQATISRALRAGLTAPIVLERLEFVNDGPIPAELVRRIQAWSKHYGNAALEQVTLLQLRDAETLAELMDDPEIGPLLHHFSPQPQALAQIHPEDIEKLRTLLAERGVEISARLHKKS
ncbi:MAG: hypothetical protein EHM70_10130 [Chloroflexota bacterium]|nr:MAG: hypothetical protein EHM70_10130 [Chloroflexota bacterium]